MDREKVSAIFDHSFPLHVLWASAAKHGMDHSLHLARCARTSPDYWLADHYAKEAEKWRVAAWEHLESAREAKRRAA